MKQPSPKKEQTQQKNSRDTNVVGRESIPQTHSSKEQPKQTNESKQLTKPLLKDPKPNIKEMIPIKKNTKLWKPMKPEKHHQKKSSIPTPSQILNSNESKFREYINNFMMEPGDSGQDEDKDEEGSNHNGDENQSVNLQIHQNNMMISESQGAAPTADLANTGLLLSNL